MAAQQIQIAETIRAMKIAFKRRPDDSGSEDDYQTQTNRGNKLSRSARFVREGRLDNTGRLAYKRKVDHAGYTRSIISKNPVLYDSEGEPFSPPTSDDERVLQPMSANPYDDIHIETVLKPLTSLDELDTHPGLSRAYHEPALTRMSATAASMLRAERENLWRAKRLLKRFEGEADWAPCTQFEVEQDALLLYKQDAVKSERNGEETTSIVTDGTDGILVIDHVKTENPNLEEQPQDQVMNDIDQPGSPEQNSDTASNSASHMHAMTTRARARSPRPSEIASPTPSDSASIPVINPWFLTPASSLPDRDLGLPPDEAEQTRKMLLLYCQKQEQVVHSLDILYSGLRKGDRLRGYVLSSAKAAGHLVPDGKNGLITEMSDGEDWFDPVEYGRLEKGKDEVEDIEEEGRRGGRRRRVVGRV